MDAFVAGAWRTPNRGEVLTGGTWRALTRGEVYRDGAWRQIVAFVRPLSVAANDVLGVANNRRATIVLSDPSQATPSGGLAPYSYVWEVLTGPAIPGAPTMAASSFSATVSPSQTSYSTARVTCTDALGSTATATITITLTNDGAF